MVLHVTKIQSSSIRMWIFWEIWAKLNVTSWTIAKKYSMEYCIYTWMDLWNKFFSLFEIQLCWSISNVDKGQKGQCDGNLAKSHRKLKSLASIQGHKWNNRNTTLALSLSLDCRVVGTHKVLAIVIIVTTVGLLSVNVVTRPKLARCLESTFSRIMYFSTMSVFSFWVLSFFGKLLIWPWSGISCFWYWLQSCFYFYYLNLIFA